MFTFCCQSVESSLILMNMVKECSIGQTHDVLMLIGIFGVYTNIWISVTTNMQYVVGAWRYIIAFPSESIWYVMFPSCFNKPVNFTSTHPLTTKYKHGSSMAINSFGESLLPLSSAFLLSFLTLGLFQCFAVQPFRQPSNNQKLLRSVTGHSKYNKLAQYNGSLRIIQY